MNNVEFISNEMLQSAWLNRDEAKLIQMMHTSIAVNECMNSVLLEIIAYRYNDLLEEILKTKQFDQEEINVLLITALKDCNYIAFDKILQLWEEDVGLDSFFSFYIENKISNPDLKVVQKLQDIKFSLERVNAYKQYVESHFQKLQSEAAVYSMNSKWFMSNQKKWEDILMQIEKKAMVHKLEDNLYIQNNTAKKTKI